MERYAIIHYHEVGLKGENRDFFERRLLENIKLALSGLSYQSAYRARGRMLVRLGAGSPDEEIKERLRRVFGIAYFALGWAAPREIEGLKQAVWELVRERSFSSFRIDTRRSDKSYPLTSPEINYQVGGFIKAQTGARVDLERAEFTCHIEITEKFALVYFEREDGPGGLPVSTGGKVVALLSGGIDSPVASYRLMKRGARVIFVHFHSFPHTTIDSQIKARRIVELLTQYQFRSKLYFVPFVEIQRQIMAFAPPGLRVVMYRRFMLRIAEEIARREGALALVAGDSLGQVASQTLANIGVISEAIKMPVLRPLIGDDKEEIVEIARRIGTYEISILPEQDCCTLFVPKHPETRAEPAEVEAAEKNLEVQPLIERAIAEARVEELSFAVSPLPFQR